MAISSIVVVPHNETIEGGGVQLVFTQGQCKAIVFTMSSVSAFGSCKRASEYAKSPHLGAVLSGACDL